MGVRVYSHVCLGMAVDKLREKLLFVVWQYSSHHCVCRSVTGVFSLHSNIACAAARFSYGSNGEGSN